MAALVKWIQDRLKKDMEEQHKNLISFLAELHQRFIYIHPFDDGNGESGPSSFGLCTHSSGFSSNGIK